LCRSTRQCARRSSGSGHTGTRRERVKGVRLSNFLLRLVPPVGRGRLAWAVLFSVQSFSAVAWYKAPDPYAVYVFYLVLVILWAPLWLIAVAGRLRDIGWNRWLALTYILPWIAFFWATSRMSVRASFVALGVSIAVQLPLMLIPGQSSAINGEHAERRKA
jgi:uncharacterized membrane protein YhaH (DUF805 family)